MRYSYENIDDNSYESCPNHTKLENENHTESAPLRYNEPTKDHYNFVLTSCLWLGIGFLTPWNMIVNSIDYFQKLFEDRVQYYIAFSYCVTNALVFIPVLLYGPRFSFSQRIILTFIIFTIIMTVLTLVNLFASFEYWFLLVIVPIVGLTDALVQSAIASYVSIFDSKYMIAFQTGSGISGIVASALKIFTKSTIPNEVETSSLIYFATGVFITWSCLIIFLLSTRTKFVSYHMQKLAAKFNNKLSFRKSGTDNNNLKEFSESDESRSNRSSEVWRNNMDIPLWESFKQVWGPALSLLLIYIITLSIFPGMLSEIKSDSFLAAESWFTILLIATYNIFDFIGKLLPSIPILDHVPPRTMYVATIARLLFYPVYILCIKGFITTPAVPIIVTMLLALTNGYLTSLFYIYGAKLVDLHEKESAVNIMTFFLVLGLAVGSSLGTAISFVL